MSQGSNQLSPPYRLIMDNLRQGLVIPFLGAGASLPIEGTSGKDLPNATQLANFLAEESAFPVEEGGDLAKIAQYYSLIGGRAPLYRSLHKIFNRDYPLTQLHRFLASMDVPMLIVTTNYDDLIERAFAEQGRPYDLVIHTSDPKVGDKLLWLDHESGGISEVNPNKLDIDLDSVSIIYKMHGTVDRQDARRDQYVITEDDYVEFLARMTRNRAVPAIFAQPFQTRHFLFLGYSLRDWNLRVVLNRIQDNRRAAEITSWGIQHKPSVMEQKFWENRRVVVYDMQLNEFVQELSAYL